VVEEHAVAGGAVDHTVEDVRYDFADEVITLPQRIPREIPLILPLIRPEHLPQVRI